MRRHIACAFLVAVALTVMPNAGRALAEEKVAGDRLLPPDVFFFANIPNVPDL
jgi:hypothetical protein